MLTNRIVKLYLEDFRAGADRLHELLDGKIMVCVPEKAKVILVGVLSALIPLGLMLLIHVKTGGTLWD